MNLQAGQYVHPGVGVSTGGGIIARVGHFESWLGRRVDVIGDFFPNNTWDGWSNSGWLFGAYKNDQDRLVLAIQMLPDARNVPGVSNAAGAAGNYDSYWISLRNLIISKNMTNITIRLGHEFNGDWYSWKAGTTSTDNESYKKYYRRIVGILRGTDGKTHFKFNWTGAVGYKSTWSKPDLTYPGNDVVDEIGMDVYDVNDQGIYPISSSLTESQKQAKASSAFTALRNINAYGMDWWASFARLKGKPLTIPEWGVWKLKNSNMGGGDNPYFIQNMYSWFETNKDVLKYHLYFDITDADIVANHRLSNLSQFPNAAKAYLNAFRGANNSSAVNFSTTSVTSALNQDMTPTGVSVKFQGQALKMVGNTWKQMSKSYVITSKTILELDVRGNGLAEFMSLGLMPAGSTDFNSRSFQFSGSTLRGVQDFNRFSARSDTYTNADVEAARAGFMHVKIPVGQYFTGLINYLVFACNADVSANAICEFGDIRLYEDRRLIFDLASIFEFSSLVVPNNFELSTDKTRLHIIKHGAKRVPISYNVGPNTTLEFDFKGSIGTYSPTTGTTTGGYAGVGIGSTTSNVANNFFQVAGPRSYGSSIKREVDGHPVWTHVKIQLSTYGISGPMNNLFFVCSNTYAQNANCEFGNLQIKN